MKPRFSLILALLALGLAARLAPYVLSHFGISIDPENTAYPWNFSPILPVCIFGGAFYGRQIMVYAIPFATYLIGDLGIWALTGRFDWGLYTKVPNPNPHRRLRGFVIHRMFTGWTIARVRFPSRSIAVSPGTSRLISSSSSALVG